MKHLLTASKVSIRRSVLIGVLVGGLALAAFVWFLQIMPVQYRATAFVNARVADGLSDLSQIDREIGTYLTLTDSWSVEALDCIDPSRCNLGGTVVANSPLNGTVIEVQAVAPTAEAAMELANESARSLVDYAESNRSRLWNGRSALELDVAEPAQRPDRPIVRSSAPEFVLAVAGAAALALLAVIVQRHVATRTREGLGLRHKKKETIAPSSGNSRPDAVCMYSGVSGEARVASTARIWDLAQIRERASVGEDSIVGRGAYVGPGVDVGKNCKIQNYVLIYEPASIEDGVFIGPGAVLTNDRFPRAVLPSGHLKGPKDWNAAGVRVGTGASVGAGAVCIGPVSIGSWSVVAAGAVVTRDVLPFALVVGSPARQAGWVGKRGVRLSSSDPVSGIFVCPMSGDQYREVNGSLEEFNG